MGSLCQVEVGRLVQWFDDQTGDSCSGCAISTILKVEQQLAFGNGGFYLNGAAQTASQIILTL